MPPRIEYTNPHPPARTDLPARVRRMVQCGYDGGRCGQKGVGGVARWRFWRKRLPLVWGAALFVLLLLFGWRERAEVAQALPLLERANYLWLLAACAAEAAFFLAQGVANQRLYRMYGRTPGVLLLTAMLLQATMLNEVLPLSGVSGGAGFVYWGDRFGYGARDSVAVVVWYTVLSYVALVPVIAVCAPALRALPPAPARAVAGGLQAVGVILLATAAFAALLWRLGRRSDGGWETGTEGAAPAAKTNGAKANVESAGTGAGARAFGRTAWRRLGRAAASHTRAELRKEWRRASAHPWNLAACLALLIAVYGLRIGMLHLCFTAIHAVVPLRTLLFAYAVTQLVATVSFAPTTLGVVDVAYTAAFGWLGVPVPIALAGTVLYRAATFWLPIPLGIACQWVLVRSVRRIQYNCRSALAGDHKP